MLCNLAGLDKATKESLINLFVMLGGDPTMSPNKAELMTAIEKFIKDIMKDSQDMKTELNMTKAKLEDVSADIGHRA